MNTIPDISISEYSDKAIVVRGTFTIDTTNILISFGGKWNERLRDGPGWIFPKTKKDQLEIWKNSGIAPEKKPSQYQRRTTIQKPEELTEEKVERCEEKCNEPVENIKNNNELVNEIKRLNRKVENLENMLSKVLNLLEPKTQTITLNFEENSDQDCDDTPPVRRLLR
jgi:hypothetical protein